MACRFKEVHSLYNANGVKFHFLFKNSLSLVGLPTYVIILIGLGAVVGIGGVCGGLWIYNTKFKKRKEYTPLRDPIPKT